MGRKIRVVPLVGLIALAAASLGIAQAPKAKAFDPSQAPEIQDRLLDGYASLDYGLGTNSSEGPPSQYYPRGSNTCSENLASNIKVNQNCLNISDPTLQGRAQAENETSIAVNPLNTNEMIAAANDYRQGDGQCFPSYSTDGGRTWNDAGVPSLFTTGVVSGTAREYWQSCGDPSVIGYDTHGDAYFGALTFNRGYPTSSSSDQSSGIYVWRSTQNDGASWSFPGTEVYANADATGTSNTLEDKPYGTIDNHLGSPYVDRIYVTWTEFAADGSAYIWESYSSDYGRSFSPRHLVSVNSPVLCSITYGVGTPNGDCNENQWSQPFVGPNGTLYVVYDNYNNPLKSAQDNENQVLLSYSTDGGNTFVGPIKVANYYDLPDCATYQDGKDAGRACVPEKGPTTNSVFRAVNYPVGAVNPTNPSQVVVTFGSYINQDSNEGNGCVPTGFNPATGDNLFTGVKTPGACNNKVLYSVSNDGGATFTGTTADPRVLPTVNTDPGQAGTDQFWQWAAFNKDGKLAVSYYDRQYGSDETTGYSDVSLSGSGDLVNWVVDRVTSSPNPPPTEFGGLFMGDYSGLAAVVNAYPLWTDTRNPDLFICSPTGPPTVCTASAPGAPATPLNDQDVYTASLPVPSK